ncbi:RsmB/NOP family class I SAM-dependent RNA methyltransferase [Dethiosulfovibrio salsuginis]|uniref:16S rRNA (Cytosine967-C5)-methyltransferase n=1 Tax=Dethiosulfovibrio salsuginis TaxID=561720 RepID=A0A1X7JTA8_9BACT|nr:RsmB/NOP family class I SAM-dependent RNA methyltransferase [Dethiosulfovibrio salsuginis]SMG30896.1 16S rRNA (cytosine967-C5)-methyltransferase [Dethiosulfovibrio salsuginis]
MVFEKKEKSGRPSRPPRGGTRPLRGIEAALEVWQDVRKGAFASESLRRVSEKVSNRDRPLTATLVYSLVRRESLWREIVGRFLKTGTGVPPAVKDALMIGAAGALELRTFEPKVLVNALVEWTKVRDERGAKVVNAVLRRIVEGGGEILSEIENSHAFADVAMRTGTPLWVARAWENCFGREEGRALVELQSQPVSLSLRLSPEVDRDGLIERLLESGYSADPSPVSAGAIRLHRTALPTALPGFESGEITPQSESSMAFLENLRGSAVGPFLDMCAGRGVKTGQLAQMYPDSDVEAWDLSGPRIGAAKKEMVRLGIGERICFAVGDALNLSPSVKPRTVILDAPCSGSGTWRRHPEAKWRFTQEDLVEYSGTQVRLLKRAVDLAGPGGTVLYGTCSLFREENEQVVARVMSDRPGLLELDPPSSISSISRKGRPWGHYLWPDSPWSDGFYMALLAVKDEGGVGR